MTRIDTKTELINTLKDSNQHVAEWFTNIPVKDFFRRLGEVWSASDNLDHLVKSHKPVAKALKVAKVTLKAMFGTPDKPSMSYEEVCQIYRDELTKGAKASGKFLPDQQIPENPDGMKAELIHQFSTASAELASVAEEWDDEDLDGYFLPHPLLGKLTLREMLYFTIYHNLRHASQEGD